MGKDKSQRFLHTHVANTHFYNALALQGSYVKLAFRAFLSSKVDIIFEDDDGNGMATAGTLVGVAGRINSPIQFLLQ